MRSMGLRFADGATSRRVKHYAVGACAVEDRIDAKIGPGTLGLGYVLQAGGYLVTLAGAPKPQASTERALMDSALRSVVR